MGAFTATTNANTAVVLTVEMRIISPRRPAIQAPLFNVIRALAVNHGSGWVGCCAATILVALVLVGCVGQSPRPFPAQPDRWLNIESFELAVFEKDGTDSGFLHIYLDGDGRPVDPVRLTPSVDPTPRDALVLELMNRDPSSSVYLGRPCYFRPDAPPCHSDLWTGARYGPRVVATLCAAVQQLAAEADRPVTVIGFSGGGALAVLVANCAESVSRIVTINGNLDTALWAGMRGFIPLQGSLNPVDVGLPKRVTTRVYLVGENDPVVPPEVSARFSESVPGRLIALPDFTHACCWIDVWTELLADIEGAGAEPSAAN